MRATRCVATAVLSSGRASVLDVGAQNARSTPWRAALSRCRGGCVYSKRADREFISYTIKCLHSDWPQAPGNKWFIGPRSPLVRNRRFRWLVIYYPYTIGLDFGGVSLGSMVAFQRPHPCLSSRIVFQLAWVSRVRKGTASRKIRSINSCDIRYALFLSNGTRCPPLPTLQVESSSRVFKSSFSLMRSFATQLEFLSGTCGYSVPRGSSLVGSCAPCSRRGGGLI